MISIKQAIAHKYWPSIPQLCHKSRALMSGQSKIPVVSQAWRQNKYLKLINEIKSPQYFKQLLQRQKSLRSQKEGRHPDFKQLRSRINNLLQVVKLISWARAYHQTEYIETKAAINKVQQLLLLAFSEQTSKTHQNIEEQLKDSFQSLQFYLYFQLVEKPSSQISQLYFNSYLHLTKQIWSLDLIKVYEAIKECEIGVIQKMILEESQVYLERMNSELIAKHHKERHYNEREMAVMISHNKKIVHTLLKHEKDLLKTILLSYLGSDSTQNSILHLQNMVYCLYLCIQFLSATSQVLEWLQSKYARQNTHATSIYLSNLFSHEDKLTCLKVDIWIALLKHSQEKKTTNLLQDYAQRIINSLQNINFMSWRYKYVVWMIDSLINQLNPSPKIILKLLQATTKHSLSSTRLLSAFLSPFITFTQSQALTPYRLTLEYKTVSWLTEQTNESLLSQSETVLCQLLPYADQHPALHSIYLPYLQRLLQLSLGKFEWSVLTKLYYFGLRWKVEQSEKGLWLMQYVRRYIMNEYAVMGIRRRQIPQTSYFYKIHQQTTPDKFYRNYFQH